MANSSNYNDRWYFTKEQLENTPSRRCGFDSHKELSHRQQAANFIQDMGQRLKVSQLCINTAIVYMHRFYVFHSFSHFPWQQMAAAALFLAAKVEEQPRKLEYVIRVANLCKNRKDTVLDMNSERYITQSQDLVCNENVLLQTLGFDVAIDHPHTHVVRCCHLVRASKDLAQTSYFMASNSLHLTTMCIQYKPTVVACFCILVACKWSNWEIPLSNEKKEWYTYVDASVTAELLQQLTEEFLVIFEKCPSRLKEKIMAIADNVHHIPNHHVNTPFDSDPKKTGVKDEKEGHPHRPSSSTEDPHMHRSSRPHEMNQHQRDRERDRIAHERISHQQKLVQNSSNNINSGNSSSNSLSNSSTSSSNLTNNSTTSNLNNSSSNSNVNNSSSASNINNSSNSSASSTITSASNQIKTHSSHHRPPIDPKMKPPSRPLYHQPKDILREASTRDSPFGLARDQTRDYLKDAHGSRQDKDSNKRDYHVKTNNQNETVNANFVDQRLAYSDKINHDKQRIDSSKRPRIEPSKTTVMPVHPRDESKTHLDNIKKHLTTTVHDKNGSYLNKVNPPIMPESSKSVPLQPITSSSSIVKVLDSYAPSNTEVKVIPVKEEVLNPPVRSLFSPEKTPPTICPPAAVAPPVEEVRQVQVAEPVKEEPSGSSDMTSQTKNKKKKDKHKHKEKNREDREKKKKHKDKVRERHKHKEKPLEAPVQSMPLKLKIPKDKIIPIDPQPPVQGLKIKIPKNKINTEHITELSQNTPMMPTTGIKLKIPKEKINNCVNLESNMNKKRDRDRYPSESPPYKFPRGSDDYNLNG